MISSIAELLIEPSEAVRMDIRNPEENIREVTFDSAKQRHSLKKLVELHLSIALFE